MTSCIISDSACLIGLDRIGYLFLLKDLYERVHIPEAVQHEFGKEIEWIEVLTVANPNTAKILQSQIDKGEAEAIALALEVDTPTLILDDKKARRIAEELGLKMIGTIGILLKAKKQGRLDQVKPVLDKLNDVNFRVSQTLYKKILEMAEEL